ncbi:unnamed protein product, partial [Brassica oleracea]
MKASIANGNHGVIPFSLNKSRNSHGEAKRGEDGVHSRESFIVVGRGGVALSHEILRFKKIAKESSAMEDLASMRGKSRETKANMRIKEALPGCDECVVTIYSTSEETNCIGDDGEFVCTRERHRKIILQWLMSK